jgi:RimJ/RimL family protein N-acetyltransferase
LSRIPPSDVRLRPLRRTDVAAVRDGLASGSGAQTTRWVLPRSLPFMLGWLDELNENPEVDIFAILVRGAFAGMCSLRSASYSGRALNIMLFEKTLRGKGVGTAAMRALCAFGFDSLKLHRIELGVYPENKGAIVCYARCGFQYEALLRKAIYHEGTWRDMMWMSLLRSEFIRR